jgi:hypothetical protein
MKSESIKWARPELVVLVRGRAEESVLLGCKLDGAGEGSEFVAGGCGLESDCSECSVIGVS